VGRDLWEAMARDYPHCIGADGRNKFPRAMVASVCATAWWAAEWTDIGAGLRQPRGIPEVIEGGALRLHRGFCAARNSTPGADVTSGESPAVFYVASCLVDALGVGVYLLFIFSSCRAEMEERLGVLETLPEDFGQVANRRGFAEGKTRSRAWSKARATHISSKRGRGMLGKAVAARRELSNALERDRRSRGGSAVKRKRITS